MAEKEGLFHRLKREGKRELVLEGIRHVGYAVIPLGWSALTALFSYTERIPLAYASTATAIVFAAASVGILQFHNLIYQRSPKGKLRFGHLLLATMRETDRRSPVTRAQIGVDFNSIAIFPMEATIDSITTVIGGRIETKKNPFPRVSIDAMSGGYFLDYAVDIAGIDLSKVVDGDFKFDIRYGRANGLRYHLVGNYRVHIKFKSPEEIEYFTWHQI